MWKLALALGIVVLVLPLGVALRGPDLLVEQVKGRPLVPVVHEQRDIDAEAEAIARADKRVTAALGDGRWEFVDTLRLSAYRPGALAACVEDSCRQAQFFNFDRNQLVVAVVDFANRRVVDVTTYQDAYPEANRTITERAQSVALADPLVQSEIGSAEIDANMAPENAWLMNSSCDTPHWCIALTYRVSGRESTIVIFVDLVTDQVAGVRWTVAPAVPEENLPQYSRLEYVCGDDLSYNAGGWSFMYEVQNNDALHVWNATYNGRPVFRSAKMVQVDVGYANQSWGYHDSVGCSAIVPAYPPNTPPVLTPISDGVVLTQDFRMGGWGGGCAYRYQQWFIFYNDGRVRVSAAAFGRGCGQDGVYTPFLRVDLGPGGETGNRFQVLRDGGWIEPATEALFEQPWNALGKQGALWRQIGADSQGFAMEPRWADNFEPGQPDGADVIALAYHAAIEGDQPNLPSMGSGYGCPGNCFPRQWISGEPVQNADIVTWYIPSAQTVATSPYYCWTVTQQQTYPCFLGPLLWPAGSAVPAPSDSALPQDQPAVGP
jgi:hypothetical protein